MFEAILERLNRKPGAWPALLVAIGMAERLALLAIGGLKHATGEAQSVAYALATKGSFADPFPWGGGPTAHLTPSMIAIEAGVYRLLGVGSRPAELLLAVIAIALCLGANLLYYRAAGLAGVPGRQRLIALALVCLVPLSATLEIRVFRVWEGGLAGFLAALGLVQILTLSRAARITWARLAGLLLTAAVLTFVNQLEGLVLYAACAFLFSRRLPMRQWMKAAGLGVSLLAIVVTPWTIRNYEQFGRFIPFRGNAGLELALADYPGALSGDEHALFLARLREIHPQQSRAAFLAMQSAGGEIPYAAALERSTKAWIVAHPGEFAVLWLRHLRQYYFPPAWQWHIYGHVRRDTIVPQALTWALSFLGLLGALCALLSWRDELTYFACLALGPGLLYAIVQPVPRYGYIAIAPLVFLAVEFARRMRTAAAAADHRPGAASAR